MGVFPPSSYAQDIVGGSCACDFVGAVEVWGIIWLAECVGPL